jgi:hypothetical protein
MSMKSFHWGIILAQVQKHPGTTAALDWRVQTMKQMARPVREQ